MNATPERWLPVPGYEGRYEVSDLGQLRSLLRYHGRSGPRTLKLSRQSNGYYGANLVTAEGARGVRLVHHLVAAAFIGPRPTGSHIRHLDGDKLNNRLANLMYGTPSENAQDTVQHGKHRNPGADKTHCKHGHEFTPENTSYGKRDGYVTRTCRTCARRRDRESWRRRKAAAAV